MMRSALLACVFAAGFVTVASAATMQFHATMNGASEVPPKQTSGNGDALATLNTETKELTYTVTFENLSGPATAAHFHGPAAPGANAGVAVPIGGKGPTSPVHGTATLTDAQMKDLEAGKWYVNVHTAANPGGEIRGQMMKGSEGHAAMPMKTHAMPAAAKPGTPANK
jgi:hypothetical protein